MSVLYLSFLSAQRKAGRVAAEGTTMLRATRIISATHNLEHFGIGIFRNRSTCFGRKMPKCYKHVTKRRRFRTPETLQ